MYIDPFSGLETEALRSAAARGQTGISGRKQPDSGGHTHFVYHDPGVARMDGHCLVPRGPSYRAMFRSPADKSFLKHMAAIILVAEMLVVSACYLIFGAPYWPVMAIWAGAAVFAAIIGFSALFSPDYNLFKPIPEFLKGKSLRRAGGAYPGFGPHEDPALRAVREQEFKRRRERDAAAAAWLKHGVGEHRDERKPKPIAVALYLWTFGPLVAVILVFAFLVWGGIDTAP